MGRFTKDDTQKILANIETLIAENCDSKTQFYEESGITSSQYSQWNTGSKNPSLSSLKKVAEYFDVPVEFLIKGDAAKTIKPADDYDEAMKIRQMIRERPEVRMLFEALSDDVPASEILTATAQILRYKERNDD